MTISGDGHSQEVTIRNLTARRIEIVQRDAPRSGVIIPPFGERVLPAGQLDRYAFEEWQAQRLITVKDRCTQAQKSTSRVTAFSYIAGYSLLATLTAGAWWALRPSRLLASAAALGLLVTVLFAYLTGWDADAWRRMRVSLNMFMGLLLAFGAPAAALSYLYADLPAELKASRELDVALVLLWLFLGMASVLPAALFLFFHRQKVPTLRNNFLRDVVRLDPNVQTIDDAETAYDGLIRDVYGSSSTGVTPGRRLPMLAATGVISGMWIGTLVPGMKEAITIPSVLTPEPHVVTFAFLGAYVFAINLLFRRYARADLGPKVYTHIIVRIFAAVVGTWVLSYAPFARGPEGQPRAMMLLLAFFIGVVPETATAIIQDVLQQWKPVGRAVPSLGEDHPLSRLEGMTLYDRSHLLEVGIENIESLAHHNIVDIMLWTRIPTARLVDFVDQAILYLHLRGPVLTTNHDGDRDEARRLLACHGIRTATDLERTCALAASRSQAEGERLLALLDDPVLPVHRLQVVLDALGDDEWMVNVRNWRDQMYFGEPVRSVEEFVDLASRAVSAVRPTPSPGSTEAVAERLSSPFGPAPPPRRWANAAAPQLDPLEDRTRTDVGLTDVAEETPRLASHEEGR